MNRRRQEGVPAETGVDGTRRDENSSGLNRRRTRVRRGVAVNSRRTRGDFRRTLRSFVVNFVVVASETDFRRALTGEAPS